MNINPIQQRNSYGTSVVQREETNPSSREKGEAAAIQGGYDQVLTTEPKATYEKPKASNEATIARLKEESERVYSQLLKLVRELLEQQGNPTASFDLTHAAHLNPDGIAVEEAQALIGPDGTLGAEQTSERIVEFAKAVSGGDPDKTPMLRDAIDKAFKEVEEMLGGLPEVSKETYRLVMEKLERWSQGEDN